MTVPTFEDVTAALHARLGESAVGHSLRVGETAARLAEVYGVEVEPARVAGALHDWDRERGADELIGDATAAGMDVSAADTLVPYLLHARTGARALAAQFPGISEEIVTAVERHTLGAVDMSPLDMVVYLADMLEPAREYEGVQELRERVGAVTLAELFALGYQHSVAHLISSRRRIHPQTVAVWNALVAGGAR